MQGLPAKTIHYKNLPGPKMICLRFTAGALFIFFKKWLLFPIVAQLLFIKNVPCQKSVHVILFYFSLLISGSI